MAILDIYHATLLGQAKIKHQALEGLQHLGFLHLISASTLSGRESGDFKNSPTFEAYLFLKHCPEKRRQDTSRSTFRIKDIEAEVLQIKEKSLVLNEERDYLEKRIKNLEPWGDFDFASLREMGGYRFWFYTVPLYELRKFDTVPLPWHIIHRDNSKAYVVIIAEEEPHDMPVARTHTGSRPLDDLRRRLDQVEAELEDLYWRRVGLTRWLTLYARALASAEDRNDLERAGQAIYDDGALFAVEAWLPAQHLTDLQHYAEAKGLLLTVRPPRADETPPTLLENPPIWQPGQTLVQFYTTPGYHLWDPSRPVFLFFVLFFSMIISDAGYGLLIGLIWLATHRRLTRYENGLQRLLLHLFIGTLLYGLFCGSYFGLSPSDGSILASLHFLDARDRNLMMLLSVSLGVLHLIVANGSTLLLNRRKTTIAPLGWIAILLGGFGWGLHAAGVVDADWLLNSSRGTLAAGILFLLLFSDDHDKKSLALPYSILRRLLHGLIALTGLTKLFGDVLSYLRLFALGLASAQLAMTFNNLAGQAVDNIAGLGTLAAILIVICGHGINFLLALMSGVIHGLRLNFIEFFNWGLAEEGYPFKPFQRRRIGIWNQL